MSTEICLPEGLIELNPSRFLSHLKSLSDVDEGGSDHQHAFISFACTVIHRPKLYTDII